MFRFTVLALCAVFALAGCNTGKEPMISLHSPVRLSTQTRPTELPPETQRAVFSGPVQAIPEAPAACAVPVRPEPQPLFGAKISTREK